MVDHWSQICSWHSWSHDAPGEATDHRHREATGGNHGTEVLLIQPMNPLNQAMVIMLLLLWLITLILSIIMAGGEEMMSFN